jgi:hypothetical protein
VQRARLVVALFLVGAFAHRAAACASCGCGDATLTATGVERPYKNRIRVVLEERYGSMVFGDDASGEHLQFLRTAVAASWSPHRRISLGMVLPWLSSWIKRGPLPRTTVNGLGDLELAARAVVWQERSFVPHHVLWATAGLKFPTGYQVYDAQGFAVADDDQPGSGSWDPLAGVTYAWFSGDLTSLFASASARYTTLGWNGYRRGTSVGGSTAVQLQPWRWGAVQLGADFLWQDADELVNHHDVPNTGGTTVYLAGALLANPWRDLLLRAAIDAPVVTVMNGTQSVGPQVVLQISYDFN